MQLSLLDPSAPHNRTETSIEAAIAAKPNIGKGQRIVLDAISNASNGLTRDELNLITGLPTATICARCNELVKQGKLGCQMVFDESKKPSFVMKKITRVTRSGKKAEVLFIKP